VKEHTRNTNGFCPHFIIPLEFCTGVRQLPAPPNLGSYFSFWITATNALLFSRNPGLANLGLDLILGESAHISRITSPSTNLLCSYKPGDEPKAHGRSKDVVVLEARAVCRGRPEVDPRTNRQKKLLPQIALKAQVCAIIEL